MTVMSDYFEAFLQKVQEDWDRDELAAERAETSLRIETGYDNGTIPCGLDLFHIAGRHWLGIIRNPYGPGFPGDLQITGVASFQVITPEVIYMTTVGAIEARELKTNLELSFIQ